LPRLTTVALGGFSGYDVLPNLVDGHHPDLSYSPLHTQPLEDTTTRNLITSQLALAGHPQMVLQLAPAATASPTAREVPGEPDSP
jgi:hypothetical protein